MLVWPVVASCSAVEGPFCHHRHRFLLSVSNSRDSLLLTSLRVVSTV